MQPALTAEHPPSWGSGGHRDLTHPGVPLAHVTMVRTQKEAVVSALQLTELKLNLAEAEQ